MSNAEISSSYSAEMNYSKEHLRKKELVQGVFSLVLLLWGLIFLLSSLINHGNSHRDEIGAAAGESTWWEADRLKDKAFETQKSSTTEVPFNNDDQSTNSLDGHAISDELLVVEKNMLNLAPLVEVNLAEMISDLEVKEEKRNTQKSCRSSHVAPDLDEFKIKTTSVKGKPVTGQAGSGIHPLEPGGKEYNYASATMGAKVLAFNKEAKGASNILDKDKDRYLRNPCSAEEKFIILELSEETLVDTIQIANYEHYSSCLKDFELLSSLVYPTENWGKIGNFTAAHVKHEQRFVLPEPKWARYLRLNLLSHYGSEFYCTLSVFEVYGVDAIETMLENLISAQDARIAAEEPTAEEEPLAEPSYRDDQSREHVMEVDRDSTKEKHNIRHHTAKGNGVDPVVETWSTQGLRVPGDTVLKILLQKVQQLNVNLSLLEQYLEEMNRRYREIFKEFDNEITEKKLILEHIRLEMKNLQTSRNRFAQDILELNSWKALLYLQLEKLIKDNADLRLDVEKVGHNQLQMENKSLAAIFVCFVFVCLAATKLFAEVMRGICRMRRSEFCSSCIPWLILLLSSSIAAFILVL